MRYHLIFFFLQIATAPCCAMVTKEQTVPFSFHKAAAEGNIQLLKELILKVDINAFNTEGNTPLHLAVINNQIDALRFLLDNKAEREVRDSNGNTPLHRAALQGSASVLELLIQRGAIVNVTNKQGNTPLHDAAMAPNTQLVRMLLDAQANPLAPDAQNHIALHVAVAYQRTDTVRHFKNTTSVHWKNRDGNTPLHIAVKSSRTSPELITVLVKELGALLSAKNNKGETALHSACIKGRTEAIKTLIDLGSSLTEMTPEGRIALHLAIANGHRETLPLFPQLTFSILTPEKDSVLHLAAASGSVPIIEYLISQGISKERTNSKGQTPLHSAAAQGCKKAISILLALEADLKARDLQGNIPLHSAAAMGQADAVKWLAICAQAFKMADAGPQARNNKNETPLHLAALANHEKTIRVLITELGANKDALCDGEHTPLQLALLKQCNDAARCLSELSGKKDSRKSDGQTNASIAPARSSKRGS